MSSAAPAVKAALFTALTSALGSSVLVCYGQPGPNQPNDIVGIMDIRSTSERDPQTLDRSRTETLTVSLTVSCFLGGTDQQTTTERAYALLAAVEVYVKTTNPTLGGLVWGDAYVADHDLAEAQTAKGVVAEIQADLVFHATI